jgi:hypothetical protein
MQQAQKSENEKLSRQRHTGVFFLYADFLYSYHSRWLVIIGVGNTLR